MAKTISAAELFEDVDVDLWGAQYRLREGTRDVQMKLAKAQAVLDGLDEVEDADPDAVVAALADVLDVLIEPLGDDGGKKVKAATVINRKWTANELGVERLTAIAESIVNAAESRGRPTSAPASAS